MSQENDVPRVSVLMSVYNNEQCLKESIDSILNQTFKDFEFIVINDASTDKSKDVIQSYDDPRMICLENNENIGLTKSLNKGLKIAKGEYIARQDGDDVSLSNRLQKQVDVLDQKKDIAVLGTHYEAFNSQGKIIARMSYPSEPAVLRWFFLFQNKIGHSSVMFRKEIVKRLGGYNESYRKSQDYELWSRLSEEGDISTIDEVLYRYRKDTIDPIPLNYTDSNQITPACQISVNNLKKLTNNAFNDIKYIFLHNLMGAGQLPKDLSLLKNNLRLLDTIIDNFHNKHKTQISEAKIKSICIEQLMIYVSPKYKAKYWFPIYLYLLKLDFLKTVKYTLFKLFRKAKQPFYKE